MGAFISLFIAKGFWAVAVLSIISSGMACYIVKQLFNDIRQNKEDIKRNRIDILELKDRDIITPPKLREVEERLEKQINQNSDSLRGEMNGLGHSLRDGMESLGQRLTDYMTSHDKYSKQAIELLLELTKR